MTDAPGNGEPPAPRHLPLSPGRERYSQRTRIALAGTLVLVLCVAVVVGILLATGTGTVPGRSVTVPIADRSASPALLQAAEAVQFHPNTEAGVGQVEGRSASPEPASDPALLAVGTSAPSFTLRTPEGVPVRLAAFRGRAVLVEFFATWCPHCAAEAPHLERLFASLPARKVGFVSVNADGEDAASVLAYHVYFGMGFPAVLDPSSSPGSFHQPGSAGPVSTAYRVGSFPTFYVIDRRGRIAWAGAGEQPDALLRNLLIRAATT